MITLSTGDQERDDHSHEGRKGTLSERMAVPTFAADASGDDLGSSARSYLRQIDAWTIRSLPQRSTSKR